MESVARPLNPHAHPVKTERHDTQQRLHHTNGGPRAVDVYQQTPYGLFVARKFDNHPRIRHWQAHLLPTQNLVVCKYLFHGHKEHDFYIDVAQITCQRQVWTVRDLYLDLVGHEGQSAEIIDTEELLDSHLAGYVSGPEVQHATEIAQRTLSSLARANYFLADWAASQGLKLFWLTAALAPGEQALAYASF